MMNMVKRISACVFVAAALKVRSRAARPSHLRLLQHGHCPALRRRAAHTCICLVFALMLYIAPAARARVGDTQEGRGT
jgi:hypothetical protein